LITRIGEPEAAIFCGWFDVDVEARSCAFAPGRGRGASEPGGVDTGAVWHGMRDDSKNPGEAHGRW